MPADGELDLSGLDILSEDLEVLTSVDVDALVGEFADLDQFLAKFEGQLPDRFLAQV